MPHLAQALPSMPQVTGESAQLLLAAVGVLGLVVLWMARSARVAAVAYREELLATAAREISHAGDLATATATITALRERLAIAERERNHG